jgi:hypothetical protein
MEPSALTYMHAFLFIQKLQEIAPVHIVAGNHDHKRSHRLSPLVTLRDVFGCALYLDQDHFDHEGVRYHVVPYLTLENHVDGREELKPFQRSGQDVLLAHGYAYGSEISTPPEHVLLPAAIMEDSRWGRIMLGHVHQHTPVDSEGVAYYSGPLQPLDYGEMRVKPGYWLHTLSPEGIWTTEDRRLPYRKFRKWEWDQGERSMDEISQIILKSLEGVDCEGMIGKVVLSGCDAEFRTSALPQRWSQVWHDQGGIHLEVDFKTRASQELLEGAYDSVPSKLDVAYYNYVEENSPELLEKAKTIFSSLSKES